MTEFCLYATPVSVYSCKVRLALALKSMEWSEFAPPDGYGSAAYRAIVPQGTVPALVHSSMVIAESETIIEYLDDIGAGRPLLPTGAQARARARALSRFIDMRVETAARALFPLVGSGKPVPRAARDTLARHLETLAQLAGPGPFLTGDSPSLPDRGLWAVSQVLAMLDQTLHLDIPAPALAASANRVPAVSRHLADFRAALAGWAISKGAA